MKKRIGAALLSFAMLAALFVPSVIPARAEADNAITPVLTTTSEPTATVTAAPGETAAPTTTVTTAPGETAAPTAQPTETAVPSASPETSESPAPSATPAQCTCGAAEGEAHKEGCPLYAKPVPDDFKHMGTCTKDCTDAECKCPCHLFNKIMACTTLEEIWAAFDEASDETVNALTDEQNEQIDAKIEALEPAPAPAVVIEESNEETVPSEIVYGTVNYTFVAPFGDPVTGGHR